MRPSVVQFIEQAALEASFPENRCGGDRILSALDAARYNLGLYMYRTPREYGALVACRVKAMAELVKTIASERKFEDDEACLEYFGRTIPPEGLRSLFRLTIERLESEQQSAPTE